MKKLSLQPSSSLFILGFEEYSFLALCMFNKKILTLFVVFSLLLAPNFNQFVQGKSNDKISWEGHSSKYFSFKYPGSWNRYVSDANADDDSLLVAYGTGSLSEYLDGKDKEAVCIKVDLKESDHEDFPPVKNEGEFYRNVKKYVQEMGSQPGGFVVSKEKFKFKKHPAYKIVVQWSEHNRTMKSCFYFILNKNVIISANYYNSSNDYSQKFADELLNTIELE